MHARVLVLALIFVAVATATPAQTPVDADLVLRGGTILDGSGAPGAVGDVAIKGERIVAVGKFQTGDVEKTIDCRGLIVAPGFIDLHTHSDQPILAGATRANVNFLTQGCTTVVTGNCGGGHVHVKEFLDKVDAGGAGTNVAHLVPHGSVREAVFGKLRREPTADELSQMKQLVELGMREGAWGMSTGLIYVPGTYAKTAELIEVSRVVAQHGGIYASHIRGEGMDLLDSVREVIDIGDQAGLHVHVSHLKATGSAAWGSLRAAAELIEKARAKGIRVTADQYPYIASSTSLEATAIPAWAREGGREAMIARFDDKEKGPKLRAEIARKLDARDRVQIATYKHRRDWVGQSLTEIAASEHKSTADVVEEIMRHGGAAVVNFGMHEDDVRYGMTLPWVATASDGSAKIPGGDLPHPRSFGTFTRKLALYSLGEKVVPLPLAVRSCTGLPADILGLSDRGYLRPDCFADVVVFDPLTLRDHATFDKPYEYSTGMRYVFVNGVPAIHAATPTGALAGKALRKKSLVDAASQSR